MLRTENVPINGPLLKEKACDFAKVLNDEGFQASEGWLEKWKKGEHICSTVYIFLQQLAKLFF